MSDSNYEKVFKQYQEWFLRDNQEKTAEVLKLKMDSMYLYVPFFGELCKVSRRDGNIRKADDSAVLVEDRLTIMQHLHYYKQTAIRAFSNHLEELRLAGKKLQGKKESLGDVSFTLQAFPRISLTYVFWDADEEFPASSNILFDNRITDWTHPESVPVLAEIGTRKLIEAAGGDLTPWIEK